uniref:Putative secreted protein n=1 Tax=Anopheles darlingi TaxID=43151 RepID=A0A2M4DL88_ANODA
MRTGMVLIRSNVGAIFASFFNLIHNRTTNATVFRETNFGASRRESINILIELNVSLSVFKFLSSSPVSTSVNVKRPNPARGLDRIMYGLRKSASRYGLSGRWRFSFSRLSPEVYLSDCPSQREGERRLVGGPYLPIGGQKRITVGGVL